MQLLTDTYIPLKIQYRFISNEWTGKYHKVLKYFKEDVSGCNHCKSKGATFTVPLYQRLY